MRTAVEDAISGSTRRADHYPDAKQKARGRQARKAVPRSSQAALDVSRTPDPVALLEEQGRSRVPELVPIRHGRMLVSPFTFFRGAALIMAADLAGTPSAGLTVQLCGDAHLSNFGMFATPERQLVFDVNDFDETLPGPVGVGRQAARREPRDRGPRPRRLRRGERGARSCIDAVRCYREAMRQFAAMTDLEVWYARSTSRRPSCAVHRRLTRRERRPSARRRREGADAGQPARVQEADPRWSTARAASSAEPPLIVPIDELARGADATRLRRHAARMFRAYRRPFRRIGACCSSSIASSRSRGRSSGSAASERAAGSRCCSGRDDDDPLFLQIKEARPRCSSGSSAQRVRQSRASASSPGQR